MNSVKTVEITSITGATNEHVAAQGAQNDQVATTIEEKRARKRQLDRLSQRRKRQKDRETMDRLKKSLESPHDPTVVHSLILKQEEDLARNYRHNQRMLQIQAIVEADLADTDKDKASGQPSPPSDDNFDQQLGKIGSVSSQARIELSSMDGNVIPLSQEPQIDLDGFSWDEGEVPLIEQSMLSSCVSGASDTCGFINVPPILSSDTSNINIGIFNPCYDYANPAAAIEPLEKTVVPAIPSTHQERSCGSCGSIWKGANANIALARRQHRMGKAQICGNEDIDSDAHVIITAIAEGWSVAEQSPFWSTAWEHLRDIDQLCHSTSGEVERLVTLYNLRRMMKYLRFPRDGLADLVPRFLHERQVEVAPKKPSQIAVQHPVVIDYFVWPGFREHVIFNHQRYCNNDFSHLYSVSIKFLWPYEVRDTYVRNRQTTLYHFSQAFLDKADDLRSYTLDLDFFTKYPEFRGDAPIYESTPRICASIHACDPGWHHFPVSQKKHLLSGRRTHPNQIEDVQDSIVM